MSKSINEIAMIAANWWGEAVCNPKFDNGDHSLQGAFAFGMAKMLVKPVATEQKERFVLMIAADIVRHLKHEQKPFLDVDYGPCRILRDAAEYAGISGGNFPWKTTMWVEKEFVAVSAGYRAPIEYLYASVDHWKRKIVSYQEMIDDYKSGKTTMDWYQDPKEREKAIKRNIAELEKTVEEYQLKLKEAEIEEEQQAQVDSIGMIADITEFAHTEGK